ncbi:MAG: histidine kinase [Raoultibacter sp.]
MNRIIDEIILLALGCLLFLLAPFDATYVVAFLCAVVAACLFEALRPLAGVDGRGGSRVSWLRYVGIGLYGAAVVVLPAFVIFWPLATFILFSEEVWGVRLCWLLPLMVVFPAVEPFMFVSVLVLCGVACLLSWRTTAALSERAHYLFLRDHLQETSLSLEQRNRDLLEKQDYEVRLATLAERSRIAREIHDNVGHLLTRCVLQTEALQVVHAQDAQVKQELADVGKTLHEAMDTVRSSVHDLHDESLDLRAGLHALVDACGIDDVRLNYDIVAPPTPVIYCLLAVARESLSNVARHSNATRVNISALEYPALFQMIVHDNGAEAGARLGAPGIGMHTMEERVHALGGTLRTSYEQGFRVFVSLPKQSGFPSEGKDA